MITEWTNSEAGKNVTEFLLALIAGSPAISLSLIVGKASGTYRLSFFLPTEAIIAVFSQKPTSE